MLRYLGILALAAIPFAASAQTPLNTTAAPQQITLSLPHGGAVDALQILTQGIRDLDYTATANTCAGASFSPGQTCTVTLAFRPTAPGERRGAVVLLDRNRTPLATQFVINQATGPILTFLPGTINTIAGNEAWIYGGDSIPATQASIFLPFGIAVDGAGNLFIADSANNRIRRVDATSGLISTIAGTGVIGATGDGGAATAATISNPTGLALDPAGNLFFSDSGNNTVRRIDAFTGLISTVAAHLSTPNGLAVSPAGFLYIADSGNNLIRSLNLGTGALATIAGTGRAGFGGDDGQATAATLNAPWSLTPAPNGDLYIADQNNHRIRKIAAGNGLITTVAGTGQAGFSGDAGPANAAQLNVPASVAFDVAGNLYIADSGNNRVRKVSAVTGFITTIAGNSGESISGDSGPADQAGLYGPYTLAVDSSGSLLVADVFHNRIRKIAAGNATLDFPPMRVGRVATAIPQTLENDGNAPLDISAFTPVTNSQLDPSTTTCSTAPLAPFATCIVAVQFAPQSTGDPVLGQFNLISDAANSPSSITLRGKVLDVDPATIVLTSGQNPSATGSPVTFSVTVTSGGATPTGTVVLLENNTTLATSQLVPGGTATLAVPNFSGGNHTLTASYAGDSSNSSAVSAPLLQVVKDQQAATATSLTSSVSPVIAGAPLTLTATVSVGNPAAATGALSGNVAFKEGLNTLGVATLINGQASLTLTNLAVGTHSILATYTGSNTYAPSDSPAIAQLVAIATSHLVMGAATNPSIAGQPLTLTALITSTGGTPTGSIQFFDHAQPLGKATIDAQGNASLVVAGPNWTPGPHTLTTFYASDGANSPAVAGPLVEVVSLATPSLTLASSQSPAPLGGPVSFNVAATSTGSIPSGPVQLLEGSTAVAVATLNNGTAVFPVSTLTLGSHILHVYFPGDTYNSPVSSPSITQVIQPTTIAVTLAASANPSLFGAAITFTAQTTASGAIPTGKVTLNEGGSTLATTTLDPSGQAVFQLANLPIGSHVLAAVYAGDATHDAATSPALTEQVLQVTATMLAGSPAKAIAGTPFTLTSHVSATTGKPITGTVTLTDGAATIAMLPVDATGTAVFTSSSLAVGPHSFVAAYSGDALNAPSTSSPALQTIDAATTATTFTTSANPSFAGTPLTLAATVTGNGGSITGSVTFLDNAKPIATVALTATGTAQVILSNLAPGNHVLSASYTGDPFNGASLSPTLTQQIAQRTTVSLVSSANPSLLTDSVTLTINVSNGVPATPPTGSVTMTDGAKTLGVFPLVNGQATYTMSSPALGNHALLASYAGDAANTPATSQPLVQVVNLRPTTTTFSASATTLTAGQPLVLVSVVQGQGARIPTGQVTFQSGITVLGSATLDASGIATLTISPAQSVLSAVAQYPGDGLFAPSVSPVVLLTINPTTSFTMTPDPTSLSMQSGDHKTITVNLTTAATFKDTLALGCAGLPPYATCTWSENQVVAGGGLPHTLTVTIDTGNPLGSGAQASSFGFSGDAGCGGVLAFLGSFVLFFLLMPKRKKMPRIINLAVLLGTLATLASLTGCGSSFTQQHTPPGVYSFELIGNGNSTGATSKTTMQLTVTQ